MKRRLLFFLVLAVHSVGAVKYYSQAGGGSGVSPASTLSIAQINAASPYSPVGDDVIIQVGTCTTTLFPATNGTSGHRIIYLGRGFYNGSGLTGTWTASAVLSSINLTGRSFVAVIGFDITQSGVPAAVPILWSNTTDCLIEDNYVHFTYYNGISSNTGTNARNIVHHNLWDDIGGLGGGYGGGGNPDVVDLYGAAHLMQYNTVLKSMDRTRPFGTGIVIRNNYWGATDSALYPLGPQYPSHTDALQSFEGAAPLRQILYERNYDTDNADTVYTSGNNGSNAHMLNVQDGAGTNGFTWAIQRFNLVIREGGSGFNYTNMSHVYIYNETYANICNTLLNTSGLMGYWTAGQLNPGTTDLSDLRNVSVVYSANMSDGQGLFQGRPTNFTSGTNHSYRPAGTNGQLPTGASPANISSSITSTPPLFTSANGTTLNDYTLQSGSPLRSAGSSFLTVSNTVTSSTTITVNNAQWLFDGTAANGWPGIDADWIKVGSNAYQKIVSVNYTTNVVTLTSAINATAGNAVLVKGNEDVGALPYSYAIGFTVTNTTATASPNALTATVNNPEAVRAMEFMVGGIPIAIVYYDGTGSFSTSNTPSGPQMVEARGLNFWASATPTISAFILVNQDPSGLSGTGVSTSSINLSWTDNSAGVDTFSVERSAHSAGVWSVIGTTGAGVVAYGDTGLATNTTYDYRVRAVSSGIFSGYSSTANATTQSPAATASGGVNPSSVGILLGQP